MSESKRLYNTEAGFFAVEIYRTMRNMGLDVAAIFGQLGQFVPVTSLNFRNNGDIHKYLWEVVEKSSRDHLIGLHVGQNMPVLRGHIIEYIFLSSASFQDALSKSNSYFALISELISLDLKIGKKAEIVFEVKMPIRHFIDFSLVQFVAFLKYITVGQFELLEIRLPYASSLVDESEYRKAFNCPVKFNSSDIAIVFDIEILSWRSPSAQPYLLAMHEVLAERFLGDIEKHDLIFRIHKELDDHLPLESLDRNSICDRLNMDPQKLKIELASIGTNFTEVVDNYQKNLACRLLRQRDQSIEQIAYITGFSEPSAFRRAFKRWTGQTPKQYSQRWR